MTSQRPSRSERSAPARGSTAGRRLLAVAALGLTLLTGCRQTPGASPAREPLFGAAAGCNVLLITMDTTRADRIGCYGFAQARTPNLDGLAGAGVRFEACFSQAPITLVSHATLMTGTYPPEHGVRDNARYALGPELPVLAEIFQKRGYRTAGFVACQVLDRRYGLQRGFEVFKDQMARSPEGRPFHDRPGGMVTEEVLAWLDTVAGGPFFGWAHFFDPHAPYTPPKPFLDSAGGSAYDGEIAFMDEQIGKLLAKLREKAMLDRTLVIAVADHGESLGEHGYNWHALLVYHGIMRVPLILSLPGRIPQGAVVPQVVGVVDVAPTLLDLMGWETPGEMSGRSLAATLRGQALPPRPIYGESDFPYENFGWAKLRFLVDEQWKYIRAPEPELFEWRTDPGELKNRAAEALERLKDYEDALASLEGAMRRRESVSVALDAETIEAMKSLGYVGGASGDPPPDAELPDPKRMVDVEEAFRRAESLLGFRRPLAAIELMAPAVERSPRSFALLELLGKAYAGAGLQELAHKTLLDALAAQPRSADTWEFLSRVLEIRGALPAAVKACEKALELFPEHQAAQRTLPRLRQADGDQAARIDQLHKDYAAHPDDATCLALSEELARRGATGEAIQTLRRRVGDAPLPAELANLLAWLLATSPQPALRDGGEAARLARLACETAPTAGALDTLGAALAEAGQYDEAAETALRALQAARSVGDDALAAAVERRLGLYRAGKPYRTPGGSEP
jgi:arylsulfatase A-like enzyme/Flp pilus assembly protein TadD